MSTPPREPGLISSLARDRHGRRVPWFVYVDADGTPDFRVVRRNAKADAFTGNLCWICGTDRGREAAFILGPMCAINRTAPEPPSHRACAAYAARACPFLTTPSMRRRDTGLPEDTTFSPFSLTRNPGAVAVWCTSSWHPFRAPDGVILYEVGPPLRVMWFAHGRIATHDEVRDSIDHGLPELQRAALIDGPDAVAILDQRHRQLLPFLPR